MTKRQEDKKTRGQEDKKDHLVLPSSRPPVLLSSCPLHSPSQSSSISLLATQSSVGSECSGSCSIT